MTATPRLVQNRSSATDSKPSGLAELIEKHRARIARQTAILWTHVGMRSWQDIALSAIEDGDEDFAGELVGLVEQRLRQMS